MQKELEDGALSVDGFPAPSPLQSGWGAAGQAGRPDLPRAEESTWSLQPQGKARAKRGGGSERVEGFLISVSSYAVF